MTPLQRRWTNLAQMLRLRRLREDMASQQLEAQRRERLTLAATLETHRQHYETTLRQHSAFLQWAHGEGAALTVNLHAQMTARRSALAEACERAEYAMIDDEEALAQLDEQIAESHAQWVRACARTRAIQQLMDRTRSDLAREREVRAERELDARLTPKAFQIGCHG